MFIIFNPTAGAGRQRRLFRALAVLRERGLQPDLAETRGPGDAEILARGAAQRGVGLIVAAGGDGTVAEVAAGIAGSPATLGLLPLGTANVLAWELGVPVSPEHAARVLTIGHASTLHPGLARFADGRTRLFVQMVGAGFDAAAVAGLDLAVKRRVGRAAYVWEAAHQLRRYAFPRIAVACDGIERDVTSVIVTKGRLYAGRHRIAPAARPAEPGFQVVLFQRQGPVGILMAGAALPLGLIPRLPGVEVVAARRIVMTAPTDVPVQADGDSAGLLPVEVTDAPSPLRILVP